MFFYRDDIKSGIFYNQKIRGIYMTPLVSGVIVFMVFCVTVLAPTQLLFNLNLLQRFAFSVLSIALFSLPTLLWLGRFLSLCMRWNIPWVWAEIIFYIPSTLVLAVIIGLYLDPAETWWKFLWTLFGVGVNVIIAVCLSVLLLEKQIRLHFTDESASLPIWKPSKRTSIILFPTNSDAIKRMQSENQYVRVFTDTGSHLLRVSLTSAIAALPTNQGIRLHRSHWRMIQKNDRVFFEQGNPRLRLADGTVLPISRVKLSEVKSLISLAEDLH